MEPRRRRGQAGQGTVEHIALVMVVALALGAVGAWVAAHVRVEANPPPILDRSLSGLDRAPTAATRVPDLGLLPRRGERGPIARAARGAARVARRGGGVLADGTKAFGAGLGRGTSRALWGFVRDPIRVLVGGPAAGSSLLRDPPSFVRAQVAAAVAYARELRALSPREAYRRFMRDLGEASADAALTGGKQLAKRAMLRALRRRLGTIPPGPAAVASP